MAVLLTVPSSKKAEKVSVSPKLKTLLFNGLLTLMYPSPIPLSNVISLFFLQAVTTTIKEKRIKIFDFIPLNL